MPEFMHFCDGYSESDNSSYQLSADMKGFDKGSLKIAEKAHGPDHPHVAQCLNNLAELYRSQSKYTEAEPLCKRALATYEKALGKDHPYVAATCENMAGCRRDSGAQD